LVLSCFVFDFSFFFCSPRLSTRCFARYILNNFHYT
jgi:hypothetical protein